MNKIRVLLKRLIGRGRTPEELAEEMAAHAALLAADLEHAGWTRDAAQAEARRRLGNATAIQETYREQRRLPWLDTLVRDAAYALRQLQRSPGFAAAAILTLALGIGANVAVYQALDAVLFRELPVREPGQLVQVQLLENGSPVHVSYPLFRELAERQTAFEGVFAVSDFPLREAVLRGRGELRGIKGTLVSGGYFRLLGVSARVGRVFGDEDDRAGAPPVAVLSDAFWGREFGRSPQAIGQVLRINSATATVIGVAPPEFFGETVGSVPDVWLPIALQPQLKPGDWINAPSSSWLSVVGRLRPGETRQRAKAELDSLYSRLIPLTPTTTGRTYTVGLAPANRGLNELESRFAKPLWLLQAIAGLALLIACSNLAGLLLARGAARQSEIGVRLALGAARGRLVRQLLTESLVVGVLGAAAAMPVANWGTKALVTLASEESWRLTVGFGWNAFAITVTLAIAATCLFGLAPALAATRLDVQGALLAGRGSQAAARTRMGRVLIVAQVAISLVMLSAASLFARSLWNLRHQDFGFDAEAVAAADIPVEFTPAMMKRHRALSGPLYETAKALPGVRSAAVSAFGILGSTQHTVTIATPDRPMRKEDFVRMVHVSPGYFETLGTRLLAGRGIEAGDRENGPKVVVLSQTAAKIWFPGADPVGRYLSTDREYNAPKARLVVGVAQDVRFGSAREPFGAVVYVPLSQEPAPVTAVLLRTSGPLRGLRGPLAAVDPTVRVGEVKPLLERIDTGLATERTLAILSAGFGVLALGLTSVGVYGVIAYAVRRRTREIGVRIALGAARGQVTRLMLTGIARLLALGLAVGALGAYFAMRAMRGTLFGIPEWDLTMPVAAGLVLVLVAVLAAWLPARRAGRLDPMDALRVD